MGKPTNRALVLKRKGISANTLNSKTYDVHKKKVLAPATLKNYEDAKRLWEAFCDYADQITPLTHGSSIPDVQVIKRFIEWWAASSIGRIQQMVNIVATKSVWQRFQAVIYRSTGKRVPRAVSEDINAWIQEDLNLTRECWKKGFCDKVVFENLLTQLVCFDSDEFAWERDRVQMIFILQLLIFSAGRPGAFVPTSYYPDIFLVYRDLTFFLLRLETGEEAFGVRVDQRWRKGEKEKIGADFQIAWLEENNSLHCPVLSFLSIAFADKAFKTIGSRSDLQKQKLGISEELRIFQYKPNKLDQPFLVKKDGSPMHYSRIWWNLKSLSHRAGYVEYVRPYDIRRGTANKLNETKEVDSRQQNQILGHSKDTTFQTNYQSSLSMVDIKGIVLRGKADKEFGAIIALRRNRRLKRLPSKLPSRAQQAYLKEWREATWEGLDRENARRKCTAAAWKRYQESWSENYDLEQLPKHRPLPGIEGSVECWGNLNEPYTKSQIMMQHDSNRRTLRDEVVNPEYSLRSSPALDSMMCLATRDYTHPALFYEGTEPLESTSGILKCRFCRTDVAKITTLKMRLKHVLACATSRKTLLSAEHFKPEHCLRCNIWFDQLEPFREHCKHHLESLDAYCGILRLRNIVVSAGRCPFCLGDPKLNSQGEYEQVIRGFTTSDKFLTHLNSHITKLRRSDQPARCPHPRCSGGRDYSLEDLLHHFYDDHGIQGDLFGTEHFPTIPPSICERSAWPENAESTLERKAKLPTTRSRTLKPSPPDGLFIPSDGDDDLILPKKRKHAKFVTPSVPTLEHFLPDSSFLQSDEGKYPIFPRKQKHAESKKPRLPTPDFSPADSVLVSSDEGEYLIPPRKQKHAEFKAPKLPTPKPSSPESVLVSPNEDGDLKRQKKRKKIDTLSSREKGTLDEPRLRWIQEVFPTSEPPTRLDGKCTGAGEGTEFIWLTEEDGLDVPMETVDPGRYWIREEFTTPEPPTQSNVEQNTRWIWMTGLS